MSDYVKKIELWPEGIPGPRIPGDECIPSLHPFLLESDKPLPSIVIAPGGAYAGKAAHEGEPIARWLNTLGIQGFVLDYRVSPNRHPAPLMDAQRAVRTVRAEAKALGVDPGRVGMLGFSAGGHLTATAGTRFDNGNPAAATAVEKQSCRPNLIILCYPVITFIDNSLHSGSAANLLGPDADDSLRRELSAEAQVGSLTPPAFIWHTAEDASVPVRNSYLFAEALSRNSVPYALHVYPKGAHGLGLAKETGCAAEWTTSCARWLAEEGFC